MPQLYDKELIQTFPPFDLSDHSMVLLEPKSRYMRNTSSLRSFTQRDTHPSCKCEVNRYLDSLDWSALVFAPNCQSKFQLFCDLVKISLDTIIPLTFARPSNYTWTMLLGWLLSARLLSSCSKRRSCQSIWLHSRIIYPAGSHFNGVHLGASMDGLDKRWESCFWIRKRLIWWIIRYWPTRSSHYA